MAAEEEHPIVETVMPEDDLDDDRQEETTVEAPEASLPVEEEEEEEAECRVCRGPAEDGRPLFHPCKCSGSIGFVHQECLQSWLAVNHHTTNKCELCGVSFRFAKQYAEATPERLPWWQVVGGVTRTCILQWMPLTIRVSMAVALWLIVAPLGTAMIYHGWMHGSMGTNVLSTTTSDSRSAMTNTSAPTDVAPATADTTQLNNDTQYALDDHEITTAQWIQNEISTAQLIHNRLTIALSSVSIQWNVLADEIVSGFVLVAVILFSFLSLMSFVDFLRAEWQEPQRQEQRRRRRRQRQQQQRNNNNNNLPPFEEDPPRRADNVDAAMAVYWEHLVQLAESNSDIDHQHSSEEDDEEDSDFVDLDDHDDDSDEASDHSLSNDGGHVDTASNDDRVDDNEAEPLLDENALEERIMAMMQERAEEDSDNEDEQQDNEPVGPIHNDERQDMGINNNDVMNDNNDNMNGRLNNENLNNGLFDDDAEVLEGDINIALDEMLGVRGPLWVVARNLMWLLAFNTLYLALFAFVPRIVGSISISMATSALSNGNNSLSSTVFLDNITAATMTATSLNATTPSQNSTVNDNTTTIDYSFVGIFRAIEHESRRVGTTFRLKDFGQVTMGYVCAALMIVLMRYVWMLLRYKPQPVNPGPTEGQYREAVRQAEIIMREAEERHPEGFPNGLRINVHVPPGEAQAENGNDNDADRAHFEFGEIPPGAIDDEGNVALGVAIDVVLAAASSIVKVGVLLFMKMFVLPVFLGTCLDLSTLSLFERTLEDCILYAGKDLFSFLFFHWVAGITFMLLVTVSVLQLREVVHPNVLAHVIRPQEPQPDLLGNLLHDPVVTHSKRLALSLVIYSFLLALQVYIPVSFFVNILGGRADILQLKLNYFLSPRLQIPIELVVFHLCMLTFLEKNKNNIGELQHYWLKFICRAMNFDKSLLPHEVGHFKLLGTMPIVAQPGNVQVDPVWRKLQECRPGKERLVLMEEKIIPNLQTSEEGQATQGTTTERGDRMIQKYYYIRIPCTSGDGETEYLNIPTKMGHYRVNRRSPHLVSDNGTMTWQIEVWEECAGAIIPRPPEGWDDLGAGGADEQGRWAWEREKKSNIECSVAKRELIFPAGQSAAGKFNACIKLGVLVFLSWCAATIASAFLLTTPLLTGRFLLGLLRIPDAFVHDPFCFALGSAIIFPLLRRMMAWAKESDFSMGRRCLAWMGSFRPPPVSKAYILGFSGFLWFICCPIILGGLYEMILMWPSQRFDGLHVDLHEVLCVWLLGSVILNLISICCVAGLLTREFWATILFEDPLRNNNPARNVEPASSWQSSNGRMARFWSVWKSVLFDWEWDKVDPQILINECALPIFLALGFCLCVPVMTCIAVQHTDTAHNQALSTRLSGVAAILIVVARSWSDEIKSWFDAAHNTARDERYLIGRLLMNHPEIDSN